MGDDACGTEEVLGHRWAHDAPCRLCGEPVHPHVGGGLRLDENGGRLATHLLPGPGSYSDSGRLQPPARLRHGPPRSLRTAPGRPSGSACFRPSPAILPLSRNTLPPYMLLVKGRTCPTELPPHPVHGSRGSPTGSPPGRAAAPAPRPGTDPIRTPHPRRNPDHPLWADIGLELAGHTQIVSATVGGSCGRDRIGCMFAK